MSVVLMNYRYGLLIPALLLVTLSVGSVSAGWPAIPLPPYIPKSPSEDIVTVEVYLSQATTVTVTTLATAVPGPIATEYGLDLFVYMKSGTPAGQTLSILVTQLKGDPASETPIMYSQFAGPTSTDPLHLTGTIWAVGMPDIAVYAWVDSPGTDRAPDTGFYKITSLSAAAPNIFFDVEGGTVGGVVMPINTLAMLAPYLALAGLIIAVSAVVVVKRRRD